MLPNLLLNRGATEIKEFIRFLLLCLGEREEREGKAPKLTKESLCRFQRWRSGMEEPERDALETRLRLLERQLAQVSTAGGPIRQLLLLLD